MEMKVIRAVVVYNGETYHEGDSVEVDNKKERQMMVRERCAVESQVIEKEVVESAEDTGMNTEKVKGKRGGQR